MTIEIGANFGRLTVVGQTVHDGSVDRRRWLCSCSCGQSIQVIESNLKYGKVKSCGCLLQDAHATHRMYGSTEYRAWAAAIQRCTNPNNPVYTHYGGRGIVVSDEWLHSFDKFFEDMGPKPSSGYSLDRKDNEGPYSAANCRWASKIDQARNTRVNVTYEFQGRRQCLAEISQQVGVGYNTLRHRLSAGLTIEEAVKPGKIRSLKKN